MAHQNRDESQVSVAKYHWNFQDSRWNPELKVGTETWRPPPNGDETLDTIPRFMFLFVLSRVDRSFLLLETSKSGTYVSSGMKFIRIVFGAALPLHCRWVNSMKWLTHEWNRYRYVFDFAVTVPERKELNWWMISGKRNANPLVFVRICANKVNVQN